jgi:hypothetical protein
MLGCFADVVACLSHAYASIDADRQSAPVDHAFMAATRHNSNYSKRLSKLQTCSKTTVDKKASSVIKELQDHLDQCQASIARLQRENKAMAAMLSLAHDTLGAQQCQHDQVSKAVYLTHEAHLSKVQPTAKEAHLHKAQCHSPRRA